MTKLDRIKYVSQINTGVVEIYFEVIAIDKPEGIYSLVQSFDDLESAKKFCLQNNYKYDIYCTFGTCNCELKIIKVISEVL